MNENFYNEYYQQGKEDVDLKQVLSKDQLRAQVSGSDEDVENAFKAYQDGSSERQMELAEMGQEVVSSDLHKEQDYYEIGYQAGLRADVEAPKENDAQLAQKSGLEPETAPFYDWVWGYHSALQHQEVLQVQYNEMEQDLEWKNQIEEQREQEGHDEPCKEYSLYY